LHKKPLKPPQLPAVSPVAGSLVRKKAS
jgi:hypothetical protein